MPTRLSLSLAKGPIAVRLTAREKAPAEAPRAAVGVAAARGITAEEILAKHQAWRAARDARWKTLSATSTLSMRFRFADLNNTLDLSLAGPFFYEKGAGFDWVWRDAYFNGVRWRGKKLPELPLLQPEKVSDMPLALTLDDAYRYVLVGEDAVKGIPCWVLDFEPRAAVSDKPVYAGRVWIARDGFAAVRIRTRQLNLTGEIQAVDETSEFTDVPAPDGGPPLSFPTRTTGQWILKTFSRTTVIERESVLTDVRLDDASFASAREEAWKSKDTMVRDTEKGVRYLEKRQGRRSTPSQRTRSAATCSASAASSTTGPTTTRCLSSASTGSTSTRASATTRFRSSSAASSSRARGASRVFSARRSTSASTSSASRSAARTRSSPGARRTRASA